MTAASRLQKIISELGRRDDLPKKIDISAYGGRYWAVCYDSVGSDVMVQESYTGFADSKELSILKALTERSERHAFLQGHKLGLASCQTDRSDGFAAMPTLGAVDAKDLARTNALNEAIERYVWSIWWDHPNMKHQVIPLELFSTDTTIQDALGEIKSHCGVEKIICIAPEFQGVPSKKVIILFARLADGGYISGGACGESFNPGLILQRALDELFRHGLAMKRFKEQNLTANTFYEKRLCHFGLGHGDELVDHRLSSQGNHVIQLPSLQIDESVPNRFEDLFAVHRCYFEDQPPFVGGELERLCL